MSSSSPPRPPQTSETSHTWSGWTVTVTKSHIMNKEQEESLPKDLKLPHLPDMLFAKNRLVLERQQTEEGQEPVRIELDPFEALKRVNPTEDLVHVALAKEWMEARKDSPHINRIVHPYDWTFTPTDYRGTLTPEAAWKIEPSNKGIDYERLKLREKILFFDEVILYEDELDDNGCAVLSAKIRVMPSCLFCLLRFYLRVDGTLIRVIDTRIYHEAGSDHLIREYTEREDKMADVTVPPAVWKDQNEIVNHLTLRKEVIEKLQFG